ncbi:hypothetical protein MRX96_006799 [Rhipicephalus microplus]
MATLAACGGRAYSHAMASLPHTGTLALALPIIFALRERLALFVTDLRFSKSKYCATSTLTVTDGTQPTSPVLATLSRPESRAFLSSEDALSLRICGGVVKFVYMSVPGETCSKAEHPVTESLRREIPVKSKVAETSLVWEEIDQTPT